MDYVHNHEEVLPTMFGVHTARELIRPDNDLNVCSISLSIHVASREHQQDIENMLDCLGISTTTTEPRTVIRVCIDSSNESIEVNLPEQYITHPILALETTQHHCNSKFSIVKCMKIALFSN